MLHYDEYGRELLEVFVGNRVGGSTSREERREAERDGGFLQELGLRGRKHAVQGKIRREK